MREVEAGTCSVHLNIRLLPFIYELLTYIYKKEYRCRSTVAFPWRFAMCFIGFDGLFFFSLSETLVVTLLLHGFCKSTKLDIYI